MALVANKNQKLELWKVSAMKILKTGHARICYRRATLENIENPFLFLSHGSSVVCHELQLAVFQRIHSVFQMQKGSHTHTNKRKEQVISALNAVALSLLKGLCRVVIHNVSIASIALSKNVDHRPIVASRGFVGIVGTATHIIVEQVIACILSPYISTITPIHLVPVRVRH